MNENHQTQTERSFPIVDGCASVLKWLAIMAILGSCGNHLRRLTEYNAAYESLPIRVPAGTITKPSTALPIDGPKISVTTKGGLVAVDVPDNWKTDSATLDELKKGELYYYAPHVYESISFYCNDQHSEDISWLSSITIEEWNTHVQETAPEGGSIISSSTEQIGERDAHVTLFEFPDQEVAEQKIDVLTFIAHYDVGDQHCTADFVTAKPYRSMTAHKEEFLRILASAKRTKNPKK